MSCQAERARVFDTGKGKDRYTVFLCKNVLSSIGTRMLKIGTTKEIQPCTCLGKEISFKQLPPAVRQAVRRHAK